MAGVSLSVRQEWIPLIFMSPCPQWHTSEHGLKLSSRAFGSRVYTQAIVYPILSPHCLWCGLFFIELEPWKSTFSFAGLLFHPWHSHSCSCHGHLQSLPAEHHLDRDTRLSGLGRAPGGSDAVLPVWYWTCVVTPGLKTYREPMQNLTNRDVSFCLMCFVSRQVKVLQSSCSNTDPLCPQSMY